MPAKTLNSTAPSEIKIRSFPYPFKAALAICNDLDNLRSFKEMKALHDVMNGRKMTPCGPGLGLEVGDSFHFYTAHPDQDDTFSYFDGTTFQPTDAAPAIRDGISSGLLDTLHTWGNFSQKGGFFRPQAENAMEELVRYHLDIPVWSNHGDIHNFQNIARTDRLGDLPNIASAYGDESKVLEYHTDLMHGIGVRYAWIKDITGVIGQERPLGLSDWSKNWRPVVSTTLKSALKPDVFNPGFPGLHYKNHLIRPGTLRDGSVIYEMLRYGYWDKAGNNHLPELLSLQVLMRLVEVQGAMQVYIHLGKGRPSPERPFSEESYQTLARLAEWSHAGDIWVTTPSRLCRYVELRQRLQLRLVEQGMGKAIVGSFNSVGELSDPAIEGLTFYPPAGMDYDLLVGSQKYQLVRNPPESDGRISCTVPLDSIEYCWE